MLNRDNTSHDMTSPIHSGVGHCLEAGSPHFFVTTISVSPVEISPLPQRIKDKSF